MDVTPATIATFRDSLLERGLSEGTARCYGLLVARCDREQGSRGIVSRLTEGDLSPNALRNNRAALVAWATFADDAKLLMRVKKIRLPPAGRIKPKIQIAPTDWKVIAKAIQDADERTEIRAILVLLAIRGFRISDVLRLRRQDVAAALRTGRLSYTAKGRKRLECDATALRPALTVLAAHRGWEVVEDLVVSPRCRSTGYQRRQAAACVVRDALVRVVKKVGIRAKPHDLRRMYSLSFLKRLDRDPQALQKLTKHMGWSSIAMAALYADEVDRGELDQVGNDLAQELLE